MATLSDLKTRIVTEMVRTDLEGDLSSQLLTHIQRACEHYSDERFWFNAIIDNSVVTTASSDSVSLPTAIRRVERVTIPTQYQELREVTLGDIEQLDGSGPSVPELYCYYNDSLKLYPTPNAAYTLRITGLKQIAAPSANTDTSAWTTEAQDLIVARTKFTLYRAQFRDADGAALARGEMQEALQRLKRETARRLETPLRPARRIGGRYNIMADR